MFIQNKPASALYKLFIGVLGTVGFWLSILSFGLSAWRLFSTYAMLAVAVYYISSALVLAISRRRDAGHPPCPMFEGMLIVTLSLLCVGTIICHLQDIQFAGASGWHASLIYFVLPFLVLSDWILFMQKGQWRLVDPFFWLSPAIIYAALIILTAIQMPASDPYRYPVSFLNFYDNGLVEMLEWFALIAVLMLIFGCTLILIDYAVSGRIAKHIVLPHIKTVVLEEEPTPETEPKLKPKIERVEVKLEPMKTPRPKTKPKSNNVKGTSARPKNTNTKGASAKPRANKVNGAKPRQKSNNQPGNGIHKKTSPKSPKPAAASPQSPDKSNG